MRKFSMILALTMMLVGAGAAFGAPYVWDADSDFTWTDDLNWDQDFFYPGTDPSDTALIQSASKYPVLAESLEIAALSMKDGVSDDTVSISVAEDIELTVDGPFTVGNSNVLSYVEKLGPGSVIPDSMSIDARAADADDENVTFKHSAGNLDVDGTISLYGSTSYNAEATLWVAELNCTPNALALHGGNSSSRRAILVADQDMTVQSTGSTFDGYSVINVADTMTFTALASTVGNSTVPSSVEKVGDGEFDATSLSISALGADANGDDVMFTHSAGTCDINGTLSVSASTSYNAEATLWVAAPNCTPNALDINGGNSSSREAILNIDEDFTVQSTGSTFDGFVSVDVADSKTFTALATTIGSSAGLADVQLGFDSSPGAGTFAASTLTLQGGDAANESAQFDVTKGILSTSGLLKLTEGSYGPGSPESPPTDSTKLIIRSAASAPSIASMEMVSQSYFDLDRDCTVTGNLKFSAESGQGNPTVDVAASKTLIADSMEFVGGPTRDLVITFILASGAVVRTN